MIFAIADAFTLDGIEGRFEGAFAIDWWAHIPKSKRESFLQVLHSKLVPGACVILVDQMPRPDSITGNYDQEGNHLQVRKLPWGELFNVIKNFTGEQEFMDLLVPLRCVNIEYRQFPEIRRCALRYSLPSALAIHDTGVNG